MLVFQSTSCTKKKDAKRTVIEFLLRYIQYRYTGSPLDGLKTLLERDPSITVQIEVHKLKLEKKKFVAVAITNLPDPHACPPDDVLTAIISNDQESLLSAGDLEACGSDDVQSVGLASDTAASRFSAQQHVLYSDDSFRASTVYSSQSATPSTADLSDEDFRRATSFTDHAIPSITDDRSASSSIISQCQPNSTSENASCHAEAQDQVSRTTELDDALWRLVLTEEEAIRFLRYQRIFTKIFPLEVVPDSLFEVRQRLLGVWVNIHDYLEALSTGGEVWVFPNQDEFVRDLRTNKARVSRKDRAKELGLGVLLGEVDDSEAEMMNGGLSYAD